MRLLDRYLLREFLVPLSYCLCGFLIFWIASDLFSELHTLQEKQLRTLDIVEFYLFRIPELLPVALPVALLLALLYTLTNHARHNEITAIRAAGVSLWRLCGPYLAVGLLASAILFGLNEYCAPKTADIAEQILSRRVQRRPNTEDRQRTKDLTFRNSRAGEDRTWVIGVYNQETGEMFQPNVEQHLPDGSWRSVSADRAVFTNDVWTFLGHVRQFQASRETNSFPVSLPLTNFLAMPEFSETPEEIRSEIKITAQHDHPGWTHRADIPVSEIVNYLRLHPNPESNIRPWLYTKLHGRFAGPCTCLVVVFIAVPFAAASGRRNVFVGVAASISIFFVYFIVQQIGFAFGEVGSIPSWLAAWLPNLMFGAAGLWMITRVR
jgi:lipopolysaccharide export system permease protein